VIAAAMIASELLPARITLPSPAAAQVGGLLITAPKTAILGTTTIGSTISAPLGTVTVGGQGSTFWTTTVTATNFTTGGGTIDKNAVSYWSGPATAITGPGIFTPGQPTAAQAVVLTLPRTAFTRSGSNGIHSVSWIPTLVINVPVTAVIGTYQGTVTHTVA